MQDLLPAARRHVKTLLKAPSKPDALCNMYWECSDSTERMRRHGRRGANADSTFSWLPQSNLWRSNVEVNYLEPHSILLHFLGALILRCVWLLNAKLGD